MGRHAVVRIGHMQHTCCMHFPSPHSCCKVQEVKQGPHQTMGGGGRRSGADQCWLAPCIRGQHVEARACTACVKKQGGAAAQQNVQRRSRQQ